MSCMPICVCIHVTAANVQYHRGGFCHENRYVRTKQHEAVIQMPIPQNCQTVFQGLLTALRLMKSSKQKFAILKDLSGIIQPVCML